VRAPGLGCYMTSLAARKATPRDTSTLLLLGAVWLIMALPSPVQAKNGDTQAQLQTLRGHLKDLEKDLNTSRGERDSLKDELRDTERDIGGLLQNLKQLDAGLRSATTQLDRLQKEDGEQRHQIETQLSHLENEMRAAYILGQQENLKLLLNQKNPADVSRALTYHRYLQAARAARIQSARAALGRLLVLQEQMRTHRAELSALRAEELKKKQTLEASRRKRSQLLAQVNQRVQNQSQERDRLQQDEQRLVRLLKELQSAKLNALRAPPRNRENSASEEPFPSLGGRFTQNKGKLPLPVKGAITARYGAPRNTGDLKWRGIFLAAPEGRNVVSVFRGRVAYADWLRGFGLLLVLEHGDGYMTLYGHNQSLYKEAGDWVEAGQTIASIGSTGGPPEPGLYFEIRHDGEPRNPLDWCKIR
jgi:murein hydrolase activator